MYEKKPVLTEPGVPAPLGVTSLHHGLNFALFSENAYTVTLLLYTPGEKHPFHEVALDPERNRTGWIWHVLVKHLPSHALEYAYRIDGDPEDVKSRFNPKNIVSDPYAKGLSTPETWGSKQWQEEKLAPKGKVILDQPFDWGDDRSPSVPMQELIIYEMHVRGLTQHTSSQTKNPGTYLGVIEKIPYLKSLGVNAIELLPIFEFDECENHNVNPKTGQTLKNFWGYSTMNFFAPMPRYARAPHWNGAINEFRQMVKELHKAGIEVIIDVVYNHTAEGNDQGPTYSFRGIDNQVYYMLEADGKYKNYSGTGNTFNANHTAVAHLILDSLRYWVTEMHVDGFRFDLASCLTRDENGAPMVRPPVVHLITNDPVLAQTKLIAEAWDAGGLYQVGSFPGEDRWAEWNGKYRDVIRRFLKGTDHTTGAFATAMSGSQDLYGRDRLPYHSINFITAHDGFTLRDLVSYQGKHNEANGEENRDGCNDNDSWNCGAEGSTNNRKVITLRTRQMKNFHTALMLAIGTPMLLMGDEYGHTRNGNNNTYCQDNELNWFLWDELQKNAPFNRFYQGVIQFRKTHPILHRTQFLSTEDVDWHGLQPFHPNWDSRFLAYTFKDAVHQQHLYIAFNANFSPVHVQLPLPPPNKHWYRVIHTSLPSPDDFVTDPAKTPPLKFNIDMLDYSAFVAIAL